MGISSQTSDILSLSYKKKPQITTAKNMNKSANEMNDILGKTRYIFGSKQEQKRCFGIRIQVAKNGGDYEQCKSLGRESDDPYL